MTVGDDWTRVERGVAGSLAAVGALLLVASLVGVVRPTYLLYLLSLSGMYVLLSLGLNVHWGYTGLINFSVAAFFGVGAYGSALLVADSSPVAGGYPPLVGLVAGLAAAAVLAVLIGYPTLKLRADYLAIASLGLAEVVRLVILNEQQWTAGSAGLTGVPLFFAGWPVVSDLPGTLGPALAGATGGYVGRGFVVALLNFLVVASFIAVTYLFLRRVHRSPWGRVLRTVRADEDLAEALGKNTFAFRMQAFVLGSVVMAAAGVFYVHLTLYLNPGELAPIRTFYVWIAVILGGSGSNRGAMLGGFVVIAIVQLTRFVNSVPWVPFDVAPLRLLLVGLLIIGIIRFRPEGILPPQRELVWPGALDEDGGSRE